MKREDLQKIYAQYMLVMGVAGQLVFYLQAFKIFAEQEAKNVSLPAFTFGFISVASWLVYGIFLKDRVLIISNIVAVIGALSVIIGIVMFR